MKKFESWDGKLLSMADRAELIHIVITPIVLYQLLIYHFPIATLIKLDNICADFFQAEKRHKISWTNLCRPKYKGGIGLKKFQERKTVGCLKLIWQFLFKDSPWSKWMRNKYYSTTHFW